MKEKITERDKNLKKQINALKREVNNLKEQSKVLQKRLDYSQDEYTKLVVMERSLLQAVNFMVEVGKRVAERNQIEQDMGLKPQDETQNEPSNTQAGIG